ncbi:MAG: hypothetical protein L0Z62_14295 [Gemmataceae bacterium]|nr:hypothetical protein [Gemmataceae bacterium]
MKCSFCEQPLVCQSCRRPFHPRSSEAHLGAFQPDTQVACPECQKVLICAACGFVYGETSDSEESE